jgi:hypothetical protein
MKHRVFLVRPWHYVAVTVALALAFAAIYLHAFYPPDTSCDERVDALRALRTCLNESTCLITLADVERLTMLERHCPSLPSD